MNKTENLLVHLNEEGCEIAHIVDKALRFGLEERWKDERNPDNLSNRERLINELNDLVAVVGMLVDADILPREWESLVKQEMKRSKVFRYMAYSRDLKTLQ